MAIPQKQADRPVIDEMLRLSGNKTEIIAEMHHSQKQADRPVTCRRRSGRRLRRLHDLSMLFMFGLSTVAGCASQVGGIADDKALGDSDGIGDIISPTSDVQLVRTPTSLEFVSAVGDQSILLDDGQITVCANGECRSGRLRAATADETTEAAMAAEDGPADGDFGIVLELDLEGMSIDAMAALRDFLDTISLADAQELASTQVAGLGGDEAAADAAASEWALSQALHGIKSYLANCAGAIVESTIEYVLYGAFASMLLGLAHAGYALAVSARGLVTDAAWLGGNSVWAAVGLGALALPEGDGVIDRILLLGMKAAAAALFTFVAYALVAASVAAKIAVTVVLISSALAGATAGCASVPLASTDAEDSVEERSERL